MRDPRVWIALLVVIYAGIVAFRPSEAWLGVPGEWTWSGRPPSPSTLPRWPPAIVSLTVAVIFILLIDRRWGRMRRVQRAAALGGLAFLIPLIQVALKFVHYRYPLEFYLHRTIGPHNGFWQAAIGIESLHAYLRTYSAVMRGARETYIHLATHPPGTVLYLWGWRRFFSLVPGLAQGVAHALRAYACADLGFVRLDDAKIAAALGQMIVPLWSGLAVFPLYDWARQLRGRRAGWRAAGLYALLPTLSLFTMRWDTLYPLFTAGAFAALHRGVTTRRVHWWVLAGWVISFASFFSFGNAVLAPIAALYAVLAIWRRRGGPRAVVAAWRCWAALLVGGYSVWAVFRVTTGVSVWELLAITAGVQRDLRAAYSYPKWLVYNLYDILAMSGFPITLPFLVESVRGLWVRRSASEDSRSALKVPALTFATAMLLLTFSGFSPGEVSRLWLHLITGCIVATVIWTFRLRDRRVFPWLIALLAFQALWLSLFLRVSATGVASYAPRNPPTRSEAPSTMARFDHGLMLADAGIHPNVVEPGSRVEVALTWYAARRTDRPYTVFVHVVAPDGTMVAQKDGMPLDNELPTSCWIPGELISDTYAVDVPASVTSGLYRVKVGWYDLATMERVELLSGNAEDAFTLPIPLEVVE